MALILRQEIERGLTYLGLHGPASGYPKVGVVIHTRRHGRASAWWRVVGCDKIVQLDGLFLGQDLDCGLWKSEELFRPFLFEIKL